MSKEEKLIIKGIQKGDKEIFKKLYESLFSRLFLYAKSYVTDNDIAEDITQDIFYYLWDKRKELIINTSISSYLFRAVHNKCIQYLKHLKVSGEYEQRLLLKQKEADILYHNWHDTSVGLNDFFEISKIIESTLSSFSAKTREIFELSRKKELQYKEISKQLNIDIKTVEYHMSKALKAFRDALKDFL